MTIHAGCEDCCPQNSERICFDLIVPIYNIEAYLTKCLQSIQDQTFPRYRVIMVDDGSTDESGAIAKEFAKRDERFLYFYKTNGGLSDARNFGFAQSSSDYVWFIDGDDYIEATALQRFSDLLSDAPVDVLEFNGWVVEDGKRTRKVNLHYKETQPLEAGIDYLCGNVSRASMYSVVWLKIVRREFLLKSRIEFERGLLHEDELWTPLIYISASSVKYVDECYYYYVQRTGSIMNSESPKKIKDMRKILYKLEKFYCQSNLSLKQVSVLRDYLAKKMVGTFNGDQIAGDELKFSLRNAKKLKTKAQIILYRMNPKIYPAFVSSIKKLLKYEG